MPVNDLLAQHQLARLNAQTAQSADDRAVFVGLESYYAGRIDDWRDTLGLPRQGWPSAAD